MFSLGGLVSSVVKPKNSDYIHIASLIEEGSVLDRRKSKKDRRINPDRRRDLALAEIYTGNNRREIVARREVIDRRLEKKKKEAAQMERDQQESEKQKKELTAVETLVAEQNKILEVACQLSISAGLSNFSVIDERVQELSGCIKNHHASEKALLRKFLNTASQKSNKKVQDALTDLNPFAACKNSLVILDKYSSTEITDTNVEPFLEDMDQLSKLLGSSLERKKQNLYKLYEQV